MDIAYSPINLGRCCAGAGMYLGFELNFDATEVKKLSGTARPHHRTDSVHGIKRISHNPTTIPLYYL